MFLGVSRRGCVCVCACACVHAFAHPLTESLGEIKGCLPSGPFFTYLFFLLKLKTRRCPIFSVPMLAKGVAFLKEPNKEPSPTQNKKQTENLTVESGLWLLNISPFYSFLMFSGSFFGFHQSAHSLHR